MLKRRIEKQLEEWKNTPNKKPLIIKGCRQCGKTFSVLDFAKNNYKNVVYLNFFENPDYASVFSGSLEVDHIIMMLSAMLGEAAVFEPGRTVLVLDEIQDGFQEIEPFPDSLGTPLCAPRDGYVTGPFELMFRANNRDYQSPRGRIVAFRHKTPGGFVYGIVNAFRIGMNGFEYRVNSVVDELSLEPEDRR